MSVSNIQQPIPSCNREGINVIGSVNSRCWDNVNKQSVNFQQPRQVPAYINMGAYTPETEVKCMEQPLSEREQLCHASYFQGPPLYKVEAKLVTPGHSRPDSHFLYQDLYQRTKR